LLPSAAAVSKPGGNDMNTLFDFISDVDTTHYALLFLSVLGFFILCGALKPNLSFFSGSSRKQKRREGKNRENEG
jgi:hypothetical protein